MIKFVLILVVTLLTGCAAKGYFVNTPLPSEEDLQPYSVIQHRDQGDVSIVLAFSGGGVRAAALSYGTMLALKETSIPTPYGEKRLLDEVDYIVSVSGGSFTSAYYGLYGDRLFEDFEDKLLYNHVGDDLKHMLFSPSLWFSQSARTQKAVEYYQDTLFGDATFGDMQRSGGPLVIINATDLGSGLRFSFLQDYFDLICSDLHSYPVADAVAASASVPLVFNPIVVKNYSACLNEPKFNYQRNSDNFQIRSTLRGLRSYEDKQRRPYIHLVDGGISDNLGLLALYEVIESAGGDEEFMNQIESKPSKHFVIVTVDASTSPERKFEQSALEPSIMDTFNAVSDIQIHRYNDVTKTLISEKVPEWAELAATESIQPIPYFIDINLEFPYQTKAKIELNAIPTDMTLDEESVTLLINEGKRQLLNNPEFQRLVTQLQ